MLPVCSAVSGQSTSPRLEAVLLGASCKLAVTQLGQSLVEVWPSSKTCLMPISSRVVVCNIVQDTCTSQGFAVLADNCNVFLSCCGL